MPSNTVSRVERSRKAITHRLQNTVKRVGKLKISDEVNNHPRYQKMSVKLALIQQQLHMTKILAGRKRFAIRVRNARLKSIPKEIEAISSAISKVNKKIDKLERIEVKIVGQLDRIYMQVINELHRNDELKSSLHNK